MGSCGKKEWVACVKKEWVAVAVSAYISSKMTPNMSEFFAEAAYQHCWGGGMLKV